MLRSSVFAIVLLLLGAPTLVFSDTLILEGLDASQASSASRPTRGMSMEKVAESWGEPVSRVSPVGDPPVARWEYERFAKPRDLFLQFQQPLQLTFRDTNRGSHRRSRRCKSCRA